MSPLSVPGRALAAALLCLTALAAPDARAQSTLLLKGSIDSKCYVDIEDQNAALNILAGHGAIRVGRVREYCNKGNGYTVTFASTNGGALIGPGGVRAAYAMSYESATSWASLQSDRTYSRTAKRTNDDWDDLWVQLPASPQAVAGDYWDTITVTIMAR